MGKNLLFFYLLASYDYIFVNTEKKILSGTHLDLVVLFFVIKGIGTADYFPS